MHEGRRPLAAAVVAVAGVLLVVACGRASEPVAAPPGTVRPPPTLLNAVSSTSTTAAPATATTVGQTSTAPPASATTAPGPADPAPVGQCRLPDLAALTRREKLAQLLMVGARSREQVQRLVDQTGIGGFIIETGGEPVLQSVPFAEMRTAKGIGLLVSTDDEGGRVQRISQGGPLPSARRMAALPPAEVTQIARDHAALLRRLGVNVDLAPVIDVSDQPDRSVIGDRSFADDPATVITYGRAFADGLRLGGTMPVFKHFPGHGHASGDSHTAGVTTTPPLSTLEGVDLVPFRTLATEAAAPLTGVMVGHLETPGLTTPGEPASISPKAIAYLRGTIGFRGLVFSDDLGGMKSITSRASLPDAVRRAIAAGTDIALWSDSAQVPAVLDALESAMDGGTLAAATVDAAVGRVLAAKAVFACPR